MPKTITVKGMGTLSLAPDCVEISLHMESSHREYAEAMELAAGKIELLNGALAEIGMEKDSVKTTGFHVRTEYEQIRDPNGNYSSVFKGYVCAHRLKIAFDFDNRQLTEALGAISRCLAQPEITVAFTVKDPSALNAALLRAAAENAREKAVLLCEASGVRLGQLLQIDYSWGERNPVSPTDYRVEAKCMTLRANGMAKMALTPDNIELSDTATFVWEIG